MILLAHSYSTKTIFDIRFSGLLVHESNQQRVQRLVKIYGLPEVEIKLLMVADDEAIDLYGRSK